MHFPVLDGLPSAPVGSEDSQPLHPSPGGVITQGSVHAPFDMVDHPCFHEVDDRLLTREGSRGKPHEVSHAQVSRGPERIEGNPIAVSEVVVG